MSETPEEAAIRRDRIRKEALELYQQLGLADAGRGRLTGFDFATHLTDEMIDDCNWGGSKST